MGKKKNHKYGMRFRGYSIGCQPMDGLISVVADPRGRYYNILTYDRMLTGQEVADYELTYIGEEEI